MDRVELRKFLGGEIDAEYPAERFESDERTYIALGYCEPGFDLRKTTMAMLTEEIAGFYDPKSKSLCLIDATRKEKPKKKSLWDKIFSREKRFNPDEQRSVLSHELAHALADQHFDLEGMRRAVQHDDDATLASVAVVEGEAMLVMVIDSMARGRGDGASHLPGVAASAELFAKTTQLATSWGFGVGSAFSSAPLVMREGLIFPYAAGMKFCAHYARFGDWKSIDALFREPPVSTEQILHPEKYRGPERDDPVRLAFRENPPLDAARWRGLRENGVGEFGVEVLLRPAVGRARSEAAAAGWDGDVYRVWVAIDEAEGDAGDGAPGGEPGDANGSRPKDDLLVWMSTWDRATDAAEFATALQEFERKRSGDIESIALDPKSPYEWAASEGGTVRLLWRSGKDVVWIRGAPSMELAESLAKWARNPNREAKVFPARKLPDAESVGGEESEIRTDETSPSEPSDSEGR